ncbi:MAG: hypothetical protein AB7V16_02810 [Vulcanibacillus sp.]
MKTKSLIICILFVVAIVAITIYVVNDQKVVMPLDRINKLDADIVYELENENWYSKIIVVDDPVELGSTKYYTKQYFYLEYIGDKDIFKENKSLIYTFSFENRKVISGETNFTREYIDQGSINHGGMLHIYPDKAALEIDVDGQVETYELLRQ